jgi:hypothetical protein
LADNDRKVDGSRECRERFPFDVFGQDRFEDRLF